MESGLQACNLRAEAVAIQDEVIGLRRQIHENPELAYTEFETAALVVKKLEEYGGFEIIQNVGVTGVVAILRGALADSSSPCYLFRADMDALPVTETSGDPHSSKKTGLHHACGHDGHTAMLLGLAKVISKWHDRINCTIKLCFQPAEEGQAGAKRMITDPKYPLLENPKVDRCFAAHLVPYAYPGEIWVKSGPFTANSDRVYIDIVGLGGHASTPQDCKDAVLIGCELVSAFQTIISRNIPPSEPAAISIGKIQAGTQANVVASECRIEGTTRSMNAKTQEIIETRMREICNGFQIAYSCSIDFTYQKLYFCTVNDESACEQVKSSASKVIPKANQIVTRDFGLAGEDFSFIAREKPSCYFCIGCAPENTLVDNNTKSLQPLHSPFFTIDERCLTLGVSIWVQLFEDLCCVTPTNTLIN